MTDALLLTDIQGAVAWVTINRPRVMNALNLRLLADLEAEVTRLAADPAIRVIVFTGAEEKAFVAGADIEEFAAASWQVYDFLRLGQRVFNRIADLNLLTVAAINGYALGGGLELALACDFRIAVETAKLGNPEIKLGHFPGWGATQRLPRLVGLAKAKELVLLGRPVSAADALQMGLVNQVVPATELHATVQRFAEELAGKPQPATGLAKQALNMALGTALEAGLLFEAQGVALCFGSPDQVEGIRSFREKRSPQFGSRRDDNEGEG